MTERAKAKILEVVDYVADTWSSIVSGLGTSRDKAVSLNASTRRWKIGDEELQNLYDHDDAAARIVDAKPEAMFREGFGICTTDKAIDKACARFAHELKIVDRFIEALEWESLYGGSLVLVGAIDGAPNLEIPLDLANLREIGYLTVVDRRDTRPVQWYDDPLLPSFGRPSIYEILPTHRQIAAPVVVSRLRVHASRCIVFEGPRCSTNARKENQGWGLSSLDRAYTALQIYNGNWASISNLLVDASQAVFKIPNLWQIMSGPNKQKLLDRFSLLDQGRSVARAFVLDKDEEFDRRDTTMSGLPELLDRTTSRLASAARMPVTVLAGISPAGLNATGESDIRNWYDAIAAERLLHVVPELDRLWRMIFASKLGPTAGVVPDFEIKWPPLWQLSPVEKAQVHNAQASADATWINAGVLVAPEVAVARFGPDGIRDDLVIDTEAYAAESAQLAAQVASGQGDLPPTNVDPNAPPPDGGAPVDAIAEHAKDPTTALNGAQVQSLIAIVQQVAARAIPRETGIALILAAFPLSSQQAENVMGAVGQTFFAQPVSVG